MGAQSSPYTSKAIRQTETHDRQPDMEVAPVVYIQKPRRGYHVVKRVFDILLSVVSLVILLPVFIVTSIAVKLDSPGPVFYKQRRIGKNGRPFDIYKFRSMRADADALLSRLSPEQAAEYEANYKLKNDFRITKVGNILRATNVDELPQLLNILSGQLSFVGPRPVVLKEAEKYGVRKELFLSVIPGLTGYWQVYRDADTSYEERIEMELYYVRNCSLLLDIKLIFLTFAVLFRRPEA